MMNWTRDSIETWRDLTFIIGHDYEATHSFDRVSIHASRDMSVEKPPDFRATHDDDLDTVLD